VQQAKNANAHGKKEQGLSQLEGRNEHEARIVPPMRRKEPGWRVSHGFGDVRSSLLLDST
jgi:hypothetical protein